MLTTCEVDHAEVLAKIDIAFGKIWRQDWPGKKEWREKVIEDLGQIRQLLDVWATKEGKERFEEVAKHIRDIVDLDP